MFDHVNRVTVQGTVSDFQWTTEDALAAVVRGGLDLAGLKFDAKGRLL